MGQLKAWRPGSVDDRTNRSRRYDGMQEDRCLGALGERIETRQSYRTSKVPRCDRCFVHVRITKKKRSAALVRVGSWAGARAKGRHRSMHRSPCTTLRIISAHLPRHTRHPSSPQQASAVFHQSPEPATNFPAVTVKFVCLVRKCHFFFFSTQLKPKRKDENLPPLRATGTLPRNPPRRGKNSRRAGPHRRARRAAGPAQS
jgi:hypothetical protein